MGDFVVKAGMDIVDVTINATGNVDNVDIILNNNNLDDWTPDLVAGTVLNIPDLVDTNPNVIRELALSPACNQSQIGNLELENLLIDLENTLKAQDVNIKEGTFVNADLDVNYTIVITHNFGTWTPVVVLRDNLGQLINDVNVIISSPTQNQISIIFPGAISGTYTYEIIKV